MTSATNADSRPAPESSPGRSTTFFATRHRRTALLIGLLLGLEGTAFYSYFMGWSIPPWDFLGSYNTDAYRWWSAGSFFAPEEWVPNVWAGYPAAITLQNSAWYLPVGAASLFGAFTLHTSAVLAALHVALGFFGTYRLVRSFGLRFESATLAATAAFFAVGYFSNAEHVDIARGYALIPWVLVVISPTWPWRKLWAGPLAVFILWQAVTGMYPGMVVATGYVGVVWVVVHQVLAKASLRNYIGPLLAAVVAAALLCMPRILPYLLMQEDAASGLSETSQFSPSMIGTLLFGYGSSELPNDISMRSFFIPATVLVLIVFAKLRHPISKLALALGVPAFLLGMPFLPWFDAAQRLPGLGLSRFTMSDFKVFLVLAAVLLASSGMESLLAARRSRPRRMWLRAVVAATSAVALTLIGLIGPFTRHDWVPEMALFGLACAIVGTYGWLARRPKAAVTVFAGSMILLTAVSGGVWAYTTSAPWLAPREQAEAATFGHSVGDLLRAKVPSENSKQRPARLPLPAGYGIDDLFSVRWNRTYYTGQLAVGGYLNLKGSMTQQQLTAALLDPDLRSSFASFLALPGTLLTTAHGVAPRRTNLEACTQGNCGPASVESLRYSPGHFAYAVSTTEGVTAIANEAYFQGWSAKVCAPHEVCRPVAVERNKLGLIQVDLPRGKYVLELDYHTPGRSAAWLLFGLGAAVPLAGLAAGLVFKDREFQRKRKRSDRIPDQPDRTV